jgi:hypothetical protein
VPETILNVLLFKNDRLTKLGHESPFGASLVHPGWIEVPARPGQKLRRPALFQQHEILFKAHATCPAARPKVKEGTDMDG